MLSQSRSRLKFNIIIIIIMWAFPIRHLGSLAHREMFYNFPLEFIRRTRYIEFAFPDSQQYIIILLQYRPDGGKFVRFCGQEWHHELDGHFDIKSHSKQYT